MAFSFVDGDLTLGPGNPTGQGRLIVTGNLTLDGNFNFNGANITHLCLLVTNPPPPALAYHSRHRQIPPFIHSLHAVRTLL